MTSLVYEGQEILDVSNAPWDEGFIRFGQASIGNVRTGSFTLELLGGSSVCRLDCNYTEFGTRSLGVNDCRNVFCIELASEYVFSEVFVENNQRIELSGLAILPQQEVSIIIKGEVN